MYMQLFFAALAVFVAGVVAENRFGLVEKTIAVLGVLAALSIVALRSIAARPWGRFIKIGLVVAVVLLLIAMGAGLFGGSSDVPPAASSRAASNWSLWPIIVAALAALAAMLMAVIGAIAGGITWTVGAIGSAFASLAKWFLLGLSGLAMLLPSGCQQQPVAVAPVVSQVAPAVVLPIRQLEHAIVLTPRKGEGCIRITRRGDHPLTLGECVKLAQVSKLRSVHNVHGLHEAPRLFASRDEAVYKGGSWTFNRK